MSLIEGAKQRERELVEDLREAQRELEAAERTIRLQAVTIKSLQAALASGVEQKP